MRKLCFEPAERVTLHSAIEFVRARIETTAKALGSVPEMVILSIFPWCFTPELYAAKPEYIKSLAGFVRTRPVQPLASFLQQSNAVIAHDVAAQLGQVKVPTQITFGRHDLVT